MNEASWKLEKRKWKLGARLVGTRESWFVATIRLTNVGGCELGVPGDAC